MQLYCGIHGAAIVRHHNGQQNATVQGLASACLMTLFRELNALYMRLYKLKSCRSQAKVWGFLFR